MRIGSCWPCVWHASLEGPQRGVPSAGQAATGTKALHVLPTDAAHSSIGKSSRTAPKSNAGALSALAGGYHVGDDAHPLGENGATVVTVTSEPAARDQGWPQGSGPASA